MKTGIILLTIPNFKTAGSQFVVLSLYNQYKKAGYKTYILISDSNPTFHSSVDKDDRLFIPKVGYLNLSDGLKYLMKMIKLMKTLNINIVHSWDYKSEIWESLACRFAGIPYVFTKKNNAWSKKWWIKSFLSHHIVYDQPKMAGRFFSHPLLKKKATFIPHGVDTGVFKHDTTVKKPTGVIGCIGNLVKNKNQLLILKALHHSGLDIRCEFYGNADANYLLDLKAFVKENKLENKVEFKGFVNNEQLPEIINHLDILILASFNEGLPVTLLEAISCGTYCLASDSGGGTRYIFDLCKAGKLFSPTNDVQLSELIKEYYRDITRIETKAKEAISIVSNQFSAKTEAEKYLSLFNRIVK